MRALTLTLPLLLVAALAQAQSSTVYQWKDANGVTQYSERPPTGRQAESRRISHRGDVMAGEAVEQAAPESANCLTARKNLEMLDGTRAISRDSDGDGKPDAVLSDSQREAERQLAQATITSQCKQP
jgi:hypothetical protein